MPVITNYIKRLAAFEPEEISVMSRAYDLALSSFPTAPPKNVREAIAAGIISASHAGERDAQRLCEKALSASSVEAQ